MSEAAEVKIIFWPKAEVNGDGKAILLLVWLVFSYHLLSCTSVVPHDPQ
jgi:hypothetical protein